MKQLIAVAACAASLVGATAAQAGTGAAGWGVGNGPGTTGAPVVVAPTSTELSGAAAVDSAGLTSDTFAVANLPPLKCYDTYGWEYWNTNAGKLTFWNYTHWCARAYYHTYSSLTYGWAGSSRPPFWEMDDPNWTKHWANTAHTQITTIASAKLKLKDPTFGIVLNEHDTHLCVKVNSLGGSSVTCHD